MKIAVSAIGDTLEATIDERFGRCRYFLIVDTETMSVEAFANTNGELSGSAGIQSAAFVASKGVEAVLTGNCGPKAMQVFSEAKIRVILNQRGVARNVVEKFNAGALNPSAEGNVPEKSGIASGATDQGNRQPGMDSGRGMSGGGGLGGGRGMGGCGRGMGGGGGRGRGGGGRGMGGGGGMGMGGRSGTPTTAGTSNGQSYSGTLSKEEEVDRLQRQADQLKRQMDDIQSKIKEISQNDG